VGLFLKKKVLVKDITIQTLIRRLDELNNRVSELEKENKTLCNEVASLKSENKALCNEVASLKSENKELRDGVVLLKTDNTELKDEIISLKTENAELRARLNSDSHNSNKPPSSDGYKKKTVKPAFNKSKNSNQGGQKGHQGRTLHQVETPDEIVVCPPGICSCGHCFTEKELELAEKRQVFELPQPRLEITEYQIFKALCPVCGREQKGVVPEGVNSPVQYGNNVKALAVLLNVHYRLPFKKIQNLFKDLFGYPINESTINQAGEKCYQRLEESEQIIKSKIIDQKVAHADETGIRVAGKLQWLHTATSLLYTYLFVHEKRGTGAIQSNKSILTEYIGWLVHDCWGSYFNLKKLNHAICGAHILRELESLIENKQAKWAKVFKLFLLDIYDMPFEQRVKRREHIESRYDRICSIGEKAEPPPVSTPGRRGRCKRTKGRNLVERLINKKDAVLAFAFNKEVPFTNNLAERDIRPAKVKQKISNCFRTFKGAEIYARIEGFISTARKNQRNVFLELCATFEGQNFITGKLTR
jgi:transposase